MMRMIGAPQNKIGRLEKEIRVYDLLERLDIPFERIDHEPLMTMAQCNVVDEALEAIVCKNLFLCNSKKDQYYLLMVVGDKKFRSRQVADQIKSSRLSFAGAQEMEAYLDITPGAVSVMGLMNDTSNKVQLLIDEDLVRYEYMGCHPCVNTSSLRIKTRDVLERFLKAVNHMPIFVHLED
nr:prolyl-tRNA synthetase associated domain-containing protein [uncultured Cellulosilyticum sp.]